MASAIDNGFVIATITGTGGDGKSYSVVQELAEQRMVRKQHDLVTNLPLRLDEFCQYAADQGFTDADELRQRIHIIDDETLRAWRQGEGGPWDLTFERPTDLYIDEAHVFCQKGNKQWEDFLGEARHQKLQRVMFLTQSIEKLAKAINIHAKVRMRIEKGDVHRTKWFAIPMAQVYELLASVTGSYAPYIYRVEEVKDAREKWHTQYSDGFKFKSKIFGLYDSHSAAGGSSEAGDTEREPQEFELRPRLLPGKRDYRRNGKPVWTAPTWLWFLGVNWEAAGKVAIAGALITFFLTGGVGLILNEWMNITTEAIESSFNTNPEDQIYARKQPQSDGDAQTPASDCSCGAKTRLLADLADTLGQEREASRSLGRLVALAPTWIKFADGDLVRVNDTIQGGPYDGQTLEEIDFPGRRIRVSGDEWVRLQARGKVEEPEHDAEIRELLQRARQEAGRPESDDRGGRSILVDRDDRNAPGPSPEHAE